MSPGELTAKLRGEATRLGFCLAGACPAVEPTGFGRLVDWLEAGYCGEMQFLTRRLEAYRHPRHVLDGVRSLLVLATDYHNVTPGPVGESEGRISRYAWGADYHDVLWQRLNTLGDFHRRLTPEAETRGVVDTAPLMEREFAVLAGLGWIGKNTLLLSRERGSWLFLSVLLTTAVLEYDEPSVTGYCGSCTACLDACPTGALIEPFVLDSRKCLSYQTIELRGMTEEPMRAEAREWFFGCDICQDVCPWNQRLPEQTVADSTGEVFLPVEGMTSVDLTALFGWDDEAFRKRFRRTPLWRAKRRGLLRNAAILLGNRQPAGAAQALARGLSDDEPLVRTASAWALARLQQKRCQDPFLDKLEESG